MLVAANGVNSKNNITAVINMAKTKGLLLMAAIVFFLSSEFQLIFTQEPLTIVESADKPGYRSYGH